MNRSKSYYRKMRHKSICRKKNICKQVDGQEWYSIDGKYSKNTIHCSCPFCATKSNNKNALRGSKNNYKPSDIKKQMRLNDQYNEYIYGE